MSLAYILTLVVQKRILCKEKKEKKEPCEGRYNPVNTIQDKKNYSFVTFHILKLSGRSHFKIVWEVTF